MAFWSLERQYDEKGFQSLPQKFFVRQASAVCIPTSNTTSYTQLTHYARVSIQHMLDSWWRHQMETFSALLTICAGNSPVTGEFPAQRPVTRNFDVFFDLICAQINGWVNNGQAGDLRRHRAHYDVTVMLLQRVSVEVWIRIRCVCLVTYLKSILW